jgi:hypothetical protein
MSELSGNVSELSHRYISRTPTQELIKVLKSITIHRDRSRNVIVPNLRHSKELDRTMFLFCIRSIVGQVYLQAVFPLDHGSSNGLFN